MHVDQPDSDRLRRTDPSGEPCVSSGQNNQRALGPMERASPNQLEMRQQKCLKQTKLVRESLSLCPFRNSQSKEKRSTVRMVGKNVCQQTDFTSFVR